MCFCDRITFKFVSWVYSVKWSVFFHSLRSAHWPDGGKYARTHTECQHFYGEDVSLALNVSVLEFGVHHHSSLVEVDTWAVEKLTSTRVDSMRLLHVCKFLGINVEKITIYCCFGHSFYAIVKFELFCSRWSFNLWRYTIPPEHKKRGHNIIGKY